MSSYYSDKDILDMFPLNYKKLREDEKDRIIDEVFCNCDVSMDRILEVLGNEDLL